MGTTIGQWRVGGNDRSGAQRGSVGIASPRSGIWIRQTNNCRARGVSAARATIICTRHPVPDVQSRLHDAQWLLLLMKRET